MPRHQWDVEESHDMTKLSEIPGVETHPVLMAKQLLTLSSFLVQFSPREEQQHLSEEPHVIRERLADVSIRLVTTYEEILGTIEALECIVLEGVYHMNCGNIRRAWLAFRRAMGVAQMMGIHRPGASHMETIIPNTIVDTEFLWNHILHMDRFLSLMLAFPQGSADGDSEIEDKTTIREPQDQIGHIHVMIMGRIIERNQLGRTPRAFSMTQKIDSQLLKNVAGLPKRLWQPPNFAGLKENSMQRFEEYVRVKDQILHYTLLNQLHLPYLFCSDEEENRTEYSRATCVSASRQILTIFITLRIYTPVPVYCHVAEFLALIAGMTLIFAHLHSHCHERNNILAHQRLGDRATVEQALENMRLVSKQNDDTLTEKCAKLLQHLLHIEDDASRGQKYSANIVQLPSDYHEDNHSTLLINVPYVGTIRIAHEGASSMATTDMQSKGKQEFGTPITVGGIGAVRIASSVFTTDTPTSSIIDPISHDARTSDTNSTFTWESQLPTTRIEEFHNNLDSSNLPMGNDCFQQQNLYPGLTAGVSEWAFQGVDTAFFDTLMQGSNSQIGHSNDLVDWGRSWQNDIGGP